MQKNNKPDPLSDRLELYAGIWAFNEVGDEACPDLWNACVPSTRAVMKFQPIREPTRRLTKSC